MGIVFRQSIKTSIVTFLGALLGAFITYLSARILSIQELGFTRDLLNQVVIGSDLILMGMHTTLFVFVERYPVGSSERKILVTLSILIPLLLTIIGIILFFLFKSSIVLLYQEQDYALVNRYILWLPIYTLLWGLMILMEQYLTSQMKVAVSIFIREVVLRIINVSLIILFAYKIFSFDAFISFTVLVHIIPVIILYYIIRQTGGFDISLKFRDVSKSAYKVIFEFAFFHTLLNFSMTLMGYIDAIMVARLDSSGLVAAGIYNIAIFIISVYEKPYRVLATAATPMLNRAFENRDMDTVRDLFRRSGVNILIVSIGMAGVVICNLQNAIEILGDVFAPISVLIPILIIGKIIDASTGLNNQMLSISSHYKFNFYITAILIVCIIGVNYILIPRYGMYGAAWSITIVLSLFNILKMVFLWRRMNLHPFSLSTVTIILSGVAATLIGFYIPYILHPIVDAAIRASIILFIYVLLLIIFKPSPDLNSYLNSIRKNKKLF